MPRLDRFRRFGLATALVLAMSAGAACADDSNKWRIEVSSDADTTGVLVFELTPVSGAPLSVTVQVPEGTDENDVAQLIHDAMVARFGDTYRVEVDDGEDVLVKKQTGAADFDLRLVSQTVRGVRIDLDRE
ncbi:MAG TPA: hypothetical protein VEY50_12125 [Lysobacter sp.]|nr:hypothetical protein [Lysobacter sp.]